MKKSSIAVNLVVWALAAAGFGALLVLGDKTPLGGITGGLLELYAPAFLAYAIGAVAGLVVLLLTGLRLRRDVRTICRVVTIVVLAGIVAAIVPPAASSGEMALSMPLLLLSYATTALPLPLVLGVVYALSWAAPREYVADETLRSERRERLEAAMEEARRAQEAEIAAARAAAREGQRDASASPEKGDATASPSASEQRRR